MSECGRVKGAYSTQDVNVGWYGYETTRNTRLRIGPGDHFREIMAVRAGKRVGIQSTRNPQAVDNPPKRPTVADSFGKHWCWVYVLDGRAVGWMKTSVLQKNEATIPWAHGPRNEDFHIGLEPCPRPRRSSCHGGRKNSVKIIERDVRLRWAPGDAAFRYLEEGDSVRELFRRSLNDYAAVVVLSSKTAFEGARGWVRVTALGNEKVTGIDVSAHQGAIDFLKVKQSGERFVICKATEGEGFIDSSFFDNVRKARAARLEVGAYHFLRPRAGRSGKDEADDFIRALDRAGLGRGDIRPTVDVETTTLGSNSTEIYVGQFVGSLRMAGFDAMLYTYPAFIDWTRTFSTDLWIAHYGVRRPTVPEPWRNYAVWQYTSSGSVPGVRGKVDRNRCPGLARIIQR